MSDKKKKITSFTIDPDLAERWDQYHEDKDISKSAHVSQLIKDEMAKKTSENFDEIQERIESEAEQDSCELLESDIPIQEDDDGNKQFLKPEDFQQRIEETKEQISEINKELSELQSEREEIILEGALNGGISKSDLEANKKQKNKLEDRKEDLEDILNQYKTTKAEAEQVEQDRKELENRLVANRMYRDIINPMTNELHERYTSFKDYFQKWLQARDNYKNAIRSSDSPQNPSNSYLSFERRLKKDLGVLDINTMGYGNTDLDGHLGDNLPIPKPPNQVEGERTTTDEVETKEKVTS